jgi:hypothetical protein
MTRLKTDGLSDKTNATGGKGTSPAARGDSRLSPPPLRELRTHELGLDRPTMSHATVYGVWTESLKEADAETINTRLKSLLEREVSVAVLRNVFAFLRVVQGETPHLKAVMAGSKNDFLELRKRLLEEGNFEKWHLLRQALRILCLDEGYGITHKTENNERFVDGASGYASALVPCLDCIRPEESGTLHIAYKRLPRDRYSVVKYDASSDTVTVACITIRDINHLADKLQQQAILSDNFGAVVLKKAVRQVRNFIDGLSEYRSLVLAGLSITFRYFIDDGKATRQLCFAFYGSAADASQEPHSRVIFDIDSSTVNAIVLPEHATTFPNLLLQQFEVSRKSMATRIAAILDEHVLPVVCEP